MYIPDINFYEAWDKLNEKITYLAEVSNVLLEENEIPSNVASQEVLDNVDTNSVDLKRLVDTILEKGMLSIDPEDTVNSGSMIIEAAKKAAIKFAKNETKWPYILQLLCNAYISENWVLSQLMQPNLKLTTAITGSTTIQNELKNVSAEFNGIHTAIFTDNTTTNDKKYDINLNIVTGNDEHITYKVEVKVVKSNPLQAKSFHKADFVVIISLDDHKVWLKRGNESTRAVKKRLANTTNVSDLLKESQIDYLGVAGEFDNSRELKFIKISPLKAVASVI